MAGLGKIIIIAWVVAFLMFLLFYCTGCAGTKGEVLFIDANENGTPEQIYAKWYRTGDIQTGVIIETPNWSVLIETDSEDYASSRWSKALPEIMNQLEPMLLKWLEGQGY